MNQAHAISSIPPGGNRRVRRDNSRTAPADGGARQIDRVLDALEAGCRTTREIEVFSQLPRKHVAAWLSSLRRDGWVRITGRVHFERDDGSGKLCPGQPACEWELVKLK